MYDLGERCADVRVSWIILQRGENFWLCLCGLEVR